MNRPTPVTDAEISILADFLRRFPSGLKRKGDLARLFQSDRRGRLVIAAAVERGELCIIYDRDSEVYRVARDIDEVTCEVDRLTSYSRQLARRARGAMNAWQAGGVARRQPDLFPPADGEGGDPA